MSEVLSIECPGGSLAATRWGAGDPVVVLLHAGIADRRAWHDVAPRLAGTVAAYDRRGYGETPPPGAEPFTDLGDLGAVLDAVADGRPAWLVGNSMGGALALDAALEQPERVAGLALIAPAVSGAPEPDEALFDADLLRIAEGFEHVSGVEERNELEIRLWLDGPSSPPGRVGGPARELALAMNAVPLGHDLDEEAGAGPVDAWSRLEEIACPVAVACGELDVSFVVEQAARIAERIPGALHRPLPGVAHLPSLERPDLVAELIEEVVRRAG